ncbi:MAG: hypothetical protein GX270_06200 [Clostridiaceae bacterium]|jgi:hypothetical protein|nr:hypothetical protein [Clostridiaceae bacterium]
MYTIKVNSSYLKQAYGDFKKEQTAQFALCFWTLDFKVSSENKYMKIRQLQFGDYEVTGKIVYLSDKVWVVDFGKIMAYGFPELVRQYEGNLKVGDFIEGLVHLDIDMFHYFEYHYKEEGIQPLIYKWNINKILKIDAPKDDIQLRKNMDRWKTIEINKTNCLYDDDGMALYLFKCELLDSEPKYKIDLHNSVK